MNVRGWGRRGVRIVVLVIAVFGVGAVLAQAPAPAKGVKFQTINPDNLKEWLTYLSSDELLGRQVFTEGYGIAAQFIAERLREWGVKPLGDHGTYFQIVKLRSYKVTRRSSVTIEANGQSRTFKDGDHVAFPASAGGAQTLVFNGAEVVGAGRTADYTGRDVAGKLAVVVAPERGGFRPTGGVSAAVRGGATAVFGYSATLRATSPSEIPPTTQRVDGLVPPDVEADQTFFDALFATAAVKPADARAALARGETLAPLTLSGVKVTINVDNVYEPLMTKLSRNVVGMVEGTDPKLKDTYVLFGAHLDHVGYAVDDRAVRADGSVAGTVRNPIETDKIWNGADDDGTGSTAEMALAKAFAMGPKPKRSLVFLWHTGEEANLYGSLYNADFPVVPLDRVQCELNIDMIGRNRDNDPRQANTVFVIGADRISTDLHNLIVDTNTDLPRPLALDYEYNDPADPNSFYTRSDHYSYASKGIPIAFFFTGTHPDYHANSDSVEKILFEKQTRIAQLIYQVGFAVADSPAILRRDNQGARSGRGFQGRLQ